MLEPSVHALRLLRSSCPVCGQNLKSNRHEWLFRCPGCGLLASTLQPNIPSERSVTAINEALRLSGLSATRRRSNNVILDLLDQFLPPTRRRLLDVGCGHGLFIESALKRNFQAEGIEPDGNVVDKARMMTGAVIRQGYFPDDLDSAMGYDAVVFNDVLEHIPDLSGALAAASSRLDIGGVLVLNCPDQRGLFYRLADLLDRFGLHDPFLRMWQVGLPSPHVWYFSATHLVRLGEQAGLSGLHVEHLEPITSAGLRQRISYVERQSKFLNAVTAVGVLALLPFLRVLPKDISIVFARKN
jgi:SAM-dependent methyltransferase